MASALHSDNERMFDSTSALYHNDRWFDTTVRSPYAYAITRQRLEALLPLDGTEEVLEIGCGAGVWTRPIAERARRVTSVDISSEMIRRAATYVRPLPVEFVHSDILAFDPGRQYDRVVTVRAIEYVRDKEALVCRLASLVAPEGELLVISKTPLSVWRGRRLLRHVATRLARRIHPGAPTTNSLSDGAGEFYQRRLSPWRLARLLRDAGMGDIEAYPVVVGLPILVGAAGDLPIIPRLFQPATLRGFNRFGNWLAATPQPTIRWTMWLSESYAIRARKPSTP